MLLERADELQALERVLDGAAAGTGALVLVAGEAGIGKTSLVRALRESAGSRLTFLLGACEPLSVPIPLGPIRELLDAAGAGDEAALHGEDRLALARALLAAIATHAPAVAVIEDAHWADPMTLDLVRLLARRIEHTRVALVITYRDDELASNTELRLLVGDLATSPAVQRIQLRPLSGAAVRELAEPHGLDATELTRATGGNPFLVVESIAAGSGIPASVRDAALARAGRLGPAARDVVDTAAVIGRRLDPALLEALIPRSTRSVEEALARGVLVADGAVLGFRHELIREAIEDSIGPPRRAELHRRVLAALAAQDAITDNARLAHHAELGGLPADACRYARLAALDAERVGALRETTMQADRALRMGAELDPTDRFELLVQYSRAANFSSRRMEDSAVAAERAVALAEDLGDPRRRGRAQIVLAFALWSLDRVGEAKAAAEQAIAVLEPAGDAAALAQAHATYVRIEATAFDPSIAIESGARALAVASAAGLTDVEIEIAISLGLARGQRGEADGIAVLSDALEAAHAAGLVIPSVRACVNLMVIGSALRDHALVDATARRADALFDELQTPIPGHAIKSYLARSLLDRGRLDEACEAAERSMVIWHAEVPGARAIEGLIAARRGLPGGEHLIEAAWREIVAVPKAPVMECSAWRSSRPLGCGAIARPRSGSSTRRPRRPRRPALRAPPAIWRSGVPATASRSRCRRTRRTPSGSSARATGAAPCARGTNSTRRTRQRSPRLRETSARRVPRWAPCAGSVPTVRCAPSCASAPRAEPDRPGARGAQRSRTPRGSPGASRRSSPSSRPGRRTPRSHARCTFPSGPSLTTFRRSSASSAPPTGSSRSSVPAQRGCSHKMGPSAVKHRQGRPCGARSRMRP